MSLENISLRNVKEDDVPILRHLAESCPPLDVHTHYTYWILCKFFQKSCFVMKKNNSIIGYITSIDTRDCVFIWQIGILKEYRSRGYSKILIKAIANYAESIQKKLQVSISEDNEHSYRAFCNYCKANNFSFTRSGELCIYDFVDKSFCENENIYDIIPNN